MIKSSLTPLLQMSPAKLHRGPFWSLAAYFACALVSLQNILGVLLSAWWRTKKFFYLLYTPGCCALGSKMNNQPTCAEHPFFIWRKNPCKSFPCYMLKSFSRSRLRHPLHWIWIKLEFLRLHCNFTSDCQKVLFLVILRPATNYNWDRCQHGSQCWMFTGHTHH